MEFVAGYIAAQNKHYTSSLPSYVYDYVLTNRMQIKMVG